MKRTRPRDRRRRVLGRVSRAWQCRHAQAGRRPAIIVQGAAASAALPTVLVVPLTSQQDALRFPGTVFVEADAANGLRRASVALVFQFAAVDNRFVAEQLGRVSETVLRALFDALDELTERSPAVP